MKQNKTFLLLILQLKLWEPGKSRPDYRMMIKGDDVPCEQKGFLVYGQHAVINDDNDTDNNVCGCGNRSNYSLLQVEAVDSESGLNECKVTQQCKKLCQYIYRRTYNLTTVATTKLCEVEIY